MRFPIGNLIGSVASHPLVKIGMLLILRGIGASLVQYAKGYVLE
jgi:hypothetical protein